MANEDLLVHATECIAYGWTDSRIGVFGEIAPWRHPPHSPVLRTIVAMDAVGRFYPKFPPIEQDWDHLTELLTVTETRPSTEQRTRA